MLTIDIHSFSYKKGGIPKDESGNGGGYCFDCRGILNPGRIDQYKPLTGKDESVQKYLLEHTEMPHFIESIKAIISISIRDYLARNFEHLQINFGCTGGQHRSVFAAETIAEYIKKHFPEAHVKLTHDEQPQLNS